MLGQPLERAVQGTAPLARPHHADVERREQFGVLAERGGEVVASLDPAAHAVERGLEAVGRHGDAGRERAGQRHARRKQRRHRARELEHAASPAHAESAGRLGRRRVLADIEREQATLFQFARHRDLGRAAQLSA